MIADLLLIAFGLSALVLAADMVIRGAAALSAAIGASPLTISLTIIALGASAPEMMIAWRAGVMAQGDLAIGAITGACIANVLLVLGAPALFQPIETRTQGLKANAAALLFAAIVWAALAFGARAIDPRSGAALLAGAIAFLAAHGVFASRLARSKALEIAFERDRVLHDPALFIGDDRRWERSVLILALGAVGLPLASHLVVTHASSLAETFEIRRGVIGASILAIGAALPELATVTTAALRGRTDVAVGAVIGAVILNVLGAGGIFGLAGGGAFGEAALSREIPVFLGALAILCAFAFSGRTIGRAAGAIMIISYIAFLAFLVEPTTSAP